jgi:phage gp45-like
LNEVEINALPLIPAMSWRSNNLQSARIAANYAMFDQTAGKIELNENVNINITPNGASESLQQPTDIKSNPRRAVFTNKEIRQIDLNGNVEVYQKPTDAVAKWTRTKAKKRSRKSTKS